MPVIGIDLGTNISSVAVPIGGKVEVLSIPTHSSTAGSSLPWISTSIQFTSCERRIGENFTGTDVNPVDYVFHIKRFLGRPASAVSLLQRKSYWPFELEFVKDRTVIHVTYRRVKRKYVPEQLAAMVLERLKQLAEERLGGEPVTDVVLACPSSFHACQRQALMDAARIARLRVVSLLNETTAAAIAYRVQMECKADQKLLVFDIGGGSINASVISIHNDLFTVIASSGHNSLGGEEFTNQIVHYFAEEFLKKYGKDLTQNKHAMERLRAACNKAKCTLSVHNKAHISLKDLHDGISFAAHITRSCFETLCENLFKHIQSLLDFVVRESRVKPAEIDEIVLVGGSSRIPRVQDLISQYFGGRKLHRQLSPEEAVVFGTGVYAETALDESNAINGMGPKFSPCVTDVIAHRLGVELNNDTMSPIVERNRTLSLKASKTYATAFTDQSVVCFNLLAGDYLLAEYDDRIGKITISDIPQAEAGKVHISLTFEVDRNGLLNVSSRVIMSGYRVMQLPVKKETVSLTDSEIEEMIEEAKKLHCEDQENKSLSLIKKSLLDYVEMKRKQLYKSYGSNRLSESNKDMLLQKYDSVVQWVTDNPACSKYRYKQKQAELDVLWEDVMDNDE